MIIELKKDDLKLISELKERFDILKDDNLFVNPFSNYLLYLQDEKVVGFINFYLIYDKMEIANFNVLDNYQNKGIGQELLDYLINKYYGNVENITLEVKKDNLKAIHLYEKKGFIKKAIRQGYYNGIDGILMERSMKE